MKKELLRLLAAIAAMSMLASFAGCGDDDDDDDKSSKKKSKSSVSDDENGGDEDDEDENDDEEPTTKKKKSSKSSSSDDDDESETEAETTEDSKKKSSDLYDYYTLFDEEYDNTDVTTATSLSYTTGISWNGKGICSHYNDDYNYEIYVFDVDGTCNKIWTGDEKTVGDDFYVDSIYFCGGYFYITADDWDDNIKLMKYDMDGKQVGTFEYTDDQGSEYISTITADGAVILDYYYSENETPVIIKSDLSGIIEAEVLNKPAAHGITEAVDSYYFNSISIGNRAYLNSYGYYLDCSNGKWVECNTVDDDHSDFYTYNNIGKYVFTWNSVYDIEAEKYTDEVPVDLYNYYYGGQHHIYLDGKQWKEYYVPSDALYVDDDDYLVSTLGSESTYLSDLVILDDENYALIDDYGIFIRTFENGDDESKETTAIIW